VLIMHFWHNSKLSNLLASIDIQFRLLIAVSLVGLGLYSLVTGSLVSANWFSYKLLIFASLVMMGLFIRINLKPLITAWGQLQSQGPSDEINQAITDSMARCTPFVWTIWVGLIANAAIGLHIIG
jgi:hypothetical protein